MGKTLSIDLQGETPGCFCIILCTWLSLADTARQTFRLHTFAFVSLELRNAVSLFCRMTINDDEIKELTSHCTNYFRAYTCSFFIGTVTPTTWTIGHIVPVHTKEYKSKYGKGLSVTSMEGREAKHIAISRYSQNTNYAMRWQKIKRDDNLDNYIPSKERYVPKRIAQNNFCFCGCPKGRGVRNVWLLFTSTYNVGRLLCCLAS